MKLRKHQAEMQAIIDGIIAGDPSRVILAKVVPGGGKSMLPLIAGKLVESGLADAICWICPRLSLQRQAEENFQDPYFRKLISHKLSIRTSTNDIDPCRSLSGFTTTYQAISQDTRRTVLKDFSRKRYILITDEHHHAQENGIWHKALMPLVEKCKYLVLMTGTLERNNQSKIAFTRYHDDGKQLRPILKSTDTVKVIEYTRQDALKEQAIIPLHFYFSDGSVTWIDETGNTIEYDSIHDAPKRDSSKALYTAINTEFAEALLDRALSHWMNYRNLDPSSRMLVVTANIAAAKQAVKFLKQKYIYSDIATSSESKSALAAIRRFKVGETQILVGCQMFYEGFDCPEVSHIVSLTHIRSTPWIEQMLSRAVRVNRRLPYHCQYGYIFTPDDALMRSIVDKIKSDQVPFANKNGNGNGKQTKLFEDESQATIESPEGWNPYGITPIGSTLTGDREFVFGDEYKGDAALEIPSDIEGRLRADIERHVRLYAYKNRYKESRINAEIKAKFGKPRDAMTIPELEAVKNHIEQAYPPNGGRGAGRPRPVRARRVWE